MKLPPLHFANAPLRGGALTVLLLCSLPQFKASGKPEALEVAAQSTSLLPGGKEADGIVGDFVLRNDRIEAVISGNQPLRRANMSTFYGPDGITPGCLYDLCLKGSHNDQITVFTPSQQQGAVSWVRILESAPGVADEAAVECFVSAEKAGGVSRRHVYRVRDGWQGVMVTTTLRNESGKPVKAVFEDRWTNFLKTGIAPGGILWADSVDPADHCGYAVGPVQDPSGALKKASGELAAGDSVTYTRFLAVGISPLAAVGEVSKRQGTVSGIKGRITDDAGKPVRDAAVFVRPAFAVEAPATTKARPNQPDSSGRLAGVAYPDAEGGFEATLPPGKYRVTAQFPGRPENEMEVELRADETSQVGLKARGAASLIAVDVRDDGGVSMPCKAQFLAQPGTEAVNLGPDQRAHGCRDQYHSEKGRFDVAIAPGRYRVIITRGIEYGHLEREVEVQAGRTVRVEGVLKRLVDTTGWVSADYHNHSTPSGDNVCGTADRLINLAAEHIEFAPTTEHNRIFNWRPEIERLGLAPFLQTVIGLESTGAKAHFNAFPFEPVPFTQDNGAPVWSADPRVNALTLREWQNAEKDRWVQINHPDLRANFFEERGTGDLEGGYSGLVNLINGYETQNYQASRLLDGVPFRMAKGSTGAETVSWNREFLWLQMLNQGRRTNAMAVADAHSVFGNGVGSWRMYMPSASDEPSKIDWRENVRAAKEGRTYLTTGPFLQVTAGEGVGPGGTVLSKGNPVRLKVRVQCTDWIDIDRVQVLVNGRMPAELNFTRKAQPGLFQDGVVKFEHVVDVPLKADAHIIVAVCGENFTLQKGYGSSAQSPIQPFAYHNPIWVDVDGNGYRHSDDALDFPDTARPVSAAQAKQFLEARKK
jgi:hypothetical protein